MTKRGVARLAVSTVTRRTVADEVSALLDSPELAELICALDDLRWTGRKGYGARALVGACLVKSLYAIPTWTRTARLIAEHHALAAAVGGTPSEWACYRFTVKLRQHSDKLAACLHGIIASLADALPEMGREVAIDATDLVAYANGQKYDGSGPRRKPFSDPDAAWGFRSAVSTRRGGGFYGFKLHAAACARTGLPLAWRIESGNRQETLFALPLLDTVIARGFSPESCAFDKGYDHNALYDGCEARDCRPIIPLRKMPTKTPVGPPTCAHGTWTFAGTDFKRGASKWRCPTGECKPKSTWVKADRRNPLIPRETKRWRSLYRGRASVEREFGRLKNEYGLAPLRVRGIERVALHADLVMLARLSQALSRVRAVPLAA
jgi:Transposase DDE domain